MLKKNVSWMNTELKVCDLCYIKFTELFCQNDEEKKIKSVKKEL